MAGSSSLRAMAALLALLPAIAAADDLLSLYREARVASASYQAARAGAEAEQENEAIALGQLMPTLSAGSSYGSNRTERQIGQLNEEFDYNSYAYSLNLRQPLFRKYNWALYQQAKAQGEAATRRLDQAGNELAVRLTGAYLEVLFSGDQLRLLAAQRLATLAQMQAAEKAMAGGSGTRIDVDEAKARYDFILAQELEARNQQMHLRRQLGAFVNREVSEIAGLDIAAFRPVEPVPRDLREWVETAERNNAEFQAALAQVEAAGQEVAKATAGHYPTLDFVASTGRSSNDNVTQLNRFADTDYTTRSYGVQLNIPLVAGGQVLATARQARAKLEQARQQAEDLRRNIGVQMGREFDNVTQGIARIVALERAEASARQSVLSAKKGVQAGLRSTLDVLQVEQQYFTTLRDLAQSRYAYLLAGLRMKALAGLLTDADMVALGTQLATAR